MKKYTDREIKEMYDRNIDLLYKVTYTYFKGDITKNNTASIAYTKIAIFAP